MNLRERIEKLIDFIKERIEEYQEKSKNTKDLSMQFYYDGLVVAFQTTLQILEFHLAETEGK